MADQTRTDDVGGYWRLRVEHARKQGAADGFQGGWHAALARIREGDTVETLTDLVPHSPLEQAYTALREQARDFVTLANTVWGDTRDGRRAKELAEKRMGELAAQILDQVSEKTP